MGGVPSHSSKLGSFIIHGGRTNAEHAAVIPEDLGTTSHPTVSKCLENWKNEHTGISCWMIYRDNIESITVSSITKKILSKYVSDSIVI